MGISSRNQVYSPEKDKYDLKNITKGVSRLVKRQNAASQTLENRILDELIFQKFPDKKNHPPRHANGRGG